MKAALDRARSGPLAAALVLLAFVGAYMVIGYMTIDEASRKVPMLAGMVTVFLLALEILHAITGGRRTDTSATEAPALHRDPGLGHASEIRVLASVVAGVAGIYLLGFVIAIPLYLIATITLIGGRPLRVALLTALLTTASIYLAFELMLSYRLFPGVLFS